MSNRMEMTMFIISLAAIAVGYVIGEWIFKRYTEPKLKKWFGDI